jgi:hypothetical protein
MCDAISAFLFLHRPKPFGHCKLLLGHANLWGKSIGDQLDQRAQPFGLLLRIASAMRPPSSCACRA